MLSTYSKAEIQALQGDGQEYSTPEPDAVEAYARGLASEMVQFFEAKMREQFPDFGVDYSDTPNRCIEDGLLDLAYTYQMECEREREQ